MTGPGKVRILILGGGHAALATARRLLAQTQSGDNLEIGIASQDTTVVWHGLMPQIVSNLIRPEDALVPLHIILPGVTIYPYEVQAIDLQNKRVTMSRGAERADVTVDYDFLVIALGSVTDVSHFPGLAEHGLQAKTIGDVFYLRNHLIEMLEMGSVESDPDQRRATLTFVMAGAGFAGVEICTEMNGLLRDALRYYPSIKPSELRVVLLSYAPRILAPLSEGLAKRAQRHIEASGIEVLTGVGLASATANTAILTNGEHIPTHTLIAAVGIGPNPVVVNLGIELARGRLPCDASCRVQGLSGVYAAGDAASVPDPSGQAYPPTLVHAHSEGVTAADNILAEIRGEPLKSYHGGNTQLALLTRAYGLFQAGNVQLDGFLASLIWRVVFLSYIPTWYRRITLALDWLVTSVFPRDVTPVHVNRTNSMVPMRFGAGEVIVRQGDPGSRFYIIAEGEVEVVRTTNQTEQVLAKLGPGQYFGEVALLRNEPRTATVRAVSDTEVLSIARGDFSALVKYLRTVRENLEQTASQRVPGQPEAPASKVADQ